MNIRGVILLCIMVTLPCTTSGQGMPLNTEPPTPPQVIVPTIPTPNVPVTAPQVPELPVPQATIQPPVAFQDTLAPATGSPITIPLPAGVTAPRSAPQTLPAPIIQIPEPAPQGRPVTALGPLPANSITTKPPQPTPAATVATPPIQPTPAMPQETQGLAAILAPNETMPGTLAGATPATPATEEKTTAIPMGKEQEAQAAADAAEKAKQEESKDIYLNFDNTELANFINYIAEIKKLNLIPDKGVEGNKISLTIREPLSVEGAWNVFLTVLEMAGFSIVEVGDVYKIVPKDKKATQPLPAYINIPVDKIPDNDSNIRYVMFLTNLQVAEIKDLVTSMLSDKASVVEVKDVNGLIIMDKCLNIKTAVKVIQELDQMGTAETVSIIKLKNANAKEVKELLDSIIKEPEASPLARLLGKTSESGSKYFPPGTRIIPEERTNSLILMGNPKPIKKIEEFIVNNIDTELQDAKSPLHVFELQFTDASQIADILQEVTQAGDSPAGQAATKYGAIRGGVKYFKKMNFKVDKDGNRLIVSSTDKVDWKLLKQTIKDLDKPQPQVAIETLIVTVSVDDNKTLGGAMRLKKENSLGGGIGFQSVPLTDSPALGYLEGDKTKPVSLLGNMMDQLVGQQGMSALTFGPTKNIWGLFNLVKSQTNTSILSQPFITAANKTKAVVTIGGSQRVVKQTGSNGQKGYESANYATTLELTPQINIDGVIRMHIKTEISEFEDPEATKTAKRNLETDVTVADGQVLVLGGFVKTSVSESKNKTPILGDLPLLGWLFKKQTRLVSKQYLFIFLAPTIVKPRQQPGMGLYTKMKLHDVTDHIEESIPTKKLPDPIHNWFFNSEKENYSHKVIDFANARYQPTTVDIKNDPYYRAETHRQQKETETAEQQEKQKAKKEPQEAPQQPSAMPSLIQETPIKALPAQISQALQVDQKREGMKNLLSVQAPSAAITPQQPSMINPDQRTEIKELISTMPSGEAQPIIDTVKLPANQPTTIEEKRTDFKELLSTKEEQPMPSPIAPAQEQAMPSLETPATPRSAPSEELTVDVSKRNRLKDFLSNNPAIANNAHHVTREGVA